jgi:hypothetical protein
MAGRRAGATGWALMLSLASGLLLGAIILVLQALLPSARNLRRIRRNRSPRRDFLGSNRSLGSQAQMPRTVTPPTARRGMEPSCRMRSGCTRAG